MLRPKRIPMSKKITPNKKRVLTAQTHILKVKDAHPHSQNNAYASFLAVNQNSPSRGQTKRRVLAANYNAWYHDQQKNALGANQNAWFRGQPKPILSGPIKTLGLAADER